VALQPSEVTMKEYSIYTYNTMRAVRCWNSCPERLWMPRPSVEVLKARLDGALGSLGWSEMWRLVALCVMGGLELHDP